MENTILLSSENFNTGNLSPDNFSNWKYIFLTTLSNLALSQTTADWNEYRLVEKASVIADLATTELQSGYDYYKNQ